MYMYIYTLDLQPPLANDSGQYLSHVYAHRLHCQSGEPALLIVPGGASQHSNFGGNFAGDLANAQIIIVWTVVMYV